MKNNLNTSNDVFQRKSSASALIKCFVITHNHEGDYNPHISKMKSLDFKPIYLASFPSDVLANKKIFLASNIEIGDFSNNLSSSEAEFEIIGALGEHISKEKIEMDFFREARVDYLIFDSIQQKLSNIIKSGFINKIHYDQNEFCFKLQPLINKLLNKKINKIYMPICRAKFCDQQCGLDITKYPQGTKCSKTLESCMKFGNVVNFRGEPFIPNKIVYPHN